MNQLLSLALAAALCAPAFAQKMGSANRNAPTVQQTVMAGDAKISLNYSSIIFGSGAQFEAAMDKDKGAQARTGINETAKKSPLGEFTTSVDVVCGDAKLAAGTYKLGFTIGEDLKWEVNFTNGDKVVKTKLNLMDSPENHKRLLMCLYAGDEEGAGVYVAYGKKNGFLTFSAAGKSDGKKG